MSLGPFDPFRKRGPLAWTFTVATVAGLFSLGLVDYLTHALAARPARVAGTIAEPETTGSIGSSSGSPLAKGLRSVVLDPCTGRERLLVKGP